MQQNTLQKEQLPFDKKISNFHYNSDNFYLENILIVLKEQSFLALLSVFESLDFVVEIDLG